MRSCNICKTPKELDEFPQNKNNIAGRGYTCNPCAKEYAKSYRDNKKEAIAAKDKVRKAISYKENKEYILTRNAIWRNANPTRMNAYSAQYRAVKKNAVFIGGDPEYYKFFMEEIYNLARERTEVTGTQHHVDHIVPLQNNKVCGLHTPDNMQILTAHDNLSKGNSFSGVQ